MHTHKTTAKKTKTKKPLQSLMCVGKQNTRLDVSSETTEAQTCRLSLQEAEGQE